jgi:hypothetical protein
MADMLAGQQGAVMISKCRIKPTGLGETRCTDMNIEGSIMMMTCTR